MSITKRKMIFTPLSPTKNKATSCNKKKCCLLCLLITIILIVSLIMNIPPTHYLIENHLIKANIINQSGNAITINDNNVQFVIGLGTKKGGSTSFNSLYISLTKHLNNNTNFNSYYYTFPGHGETHYWESCLLMASVPIFKKINDYFNIIHSHQIENTRCDFNEYLELKFPAALNFKDKTKQLIISEKTPDYFGYYHSSYFLSYYAYKYRIKFYVLLRNPIYRTWSSYWLYNALHAKSKLDIKDTNKMQQIIENDINKFSKYYDEYSTLLKYIEGNDYNQTGEYNQYVVHLYVKGVYNIWSRFHNKMNSILMMSCYFPILLMWKQMIEVQIVNWQFQTKKK
eukprot:479163_1